ncbi:hypothetical protein ACKVWC_011449 [Pyricularia oryzae]
MNHRYLLEWLEAIPFEPIAPLPENRKRKREARPVGLRTPPPDNSETSETSILPDMNTPAKRTAADAVDANDDETPRATRSQPAEESISSSSRASSHTSQSKRRKEMEVLASLRNRSFGRSGANDAIPETLSNLVRDLRQATSGKPIITPCRKEEIERAGLAGDDIFDSHYFPQGSKEIKSPAFKEILKIQRRAGRYAESSYDEAAWGTGIVFPLLELAIPDDEQLLVVPCASDG